MEADICPRKEGRECLWTEETDVVNRNSGL